MEKQTITILLQDKKQESNIKEVKEVNTNNRKAHLKKYGDLCLQEFKGFGFESFKAFIKLFKGLLYGFVVLGDLLLIGLEKNKNRYKKTDKERPKKNILDEGW